MPTNPDGAYLAFTFKAWASRASTMLYPTLILSNRYIGKYIQYLLLTCCTMFFYFFMNCCSEMFRPQFLAIFKKLASLSMSTAYVVTFLRELWK